MVLDYIGRWREKGMNVGMRRWVVDWVEKEVEKKWMESLFVEVIEYLIWEI